MWCLTAHFTTTCPCQGDVAGFRESLVAHTETTEWPWERGETSKDPFKQGSFLWRVYWQQRGGAAQNIRNQHFSKILIKTWEKHDKVRHGLSVQLLCKRNFWGYLAAVQRTGHWKNRPNGIITSHSPDFCLECLFRGRHCLKEKIPPPGKRAGHSPGWGWGYSTSGHFYSPGAKGWSREEEGGQFRGALQKDVCIVVGLGISCEVGLGWTWPPQRMCVSGKAGETELSFCSVLQVL